MQRQVSERSMSRATFYTRLGALTSYPIGRAIAGPAASASSRHPTHERGVNGNRKLSSSRQGGFY
jgi:hypothetical protein